jgi:peptide/nickel transport system substrate-binding protein
MPNLLKERGSSHSRRRAIIALPALGLLLVLAGCGAGTSSPSSSASAVITFAEQPGAYPDYIFPMANGSNLLTVNVQQLQYLMYRPLYWFGDRGQPVFNASLSLAKPPVYSHDNTVVTIRMKGWKWSNGETVNARDVDFWMNLLEQEKANFGAYVPGSLPDNVVSYKVVSPLVFQLTLAKPVSTLWFTYNQLSEITPLPIAWDRTSASAKPGSYDLTRGGAVAVYKFLIAQAADKAAYASNPLWQVVDGPWRLMTFTSSGYVALVPNRHYSGSPKPQIKEFIEEPFTSQAAELNGVLSGAVDYGYLPPEDITSSTISTYRGYDAIPWTSWAYTYAEYDYLNPTAGPIFGQPYFRLAMQYLTPQEEFVNSVFHGIATVATGVVPLQPPSPYVSSQEKGNPYPYSPSKAISLLTSHGWKVDPKGVSTCGRPGTGPGECGAGIAPGARLVFTMMYASGVQALTEEMDAMKTSLSAAGIDLTLTSGPVNNLVGESLTCAGTHTISSKCSWQMFYAGAPSWYYEPDFYPTGDENFATDAAYNGQGYSNPAADALIKATEEPGGGLAVLYRYENFMVANDPQLVLPTPPYQISLIKPYLKGVAPQDPLLNLNPENWYVTK